MCAAKDVDFEEVDDLAEVASEVDVLYQTRIQKERFQDRPEDYDLAKGKYIIDSETLKILPRKSIIMHPLPRVDEVGRPPSFDLLRPLAILPGQRAVLPGRTLPNLLL